MRRKYGNDNLKSKKKATVRRGINKDPAKMVIGLLILASIPTVTGVAEGISAQRNQEERVKDARRMRKFHISVFCEAPSRKAPEIRGGKIVLWGGRVWIEKVNDEIDDEIPPRRDTEAEAETREHTQGKGEEAVSGGGKSGNRKMQRYASGDWRYDPTRSLVPFSPPPALLVELPQEDKSKAYLAETFYVEYPDKARVPAEMGLVTRTSDDPPMLNWMYVDTETMELRYGNRTQSIQHLVGSWDWISPDDDEDDDEEDDAGNGLKQRGKEKEAKGANAKEKEDPDNLGITLDGEERFVAVEIEAQRGENPSGPETSSPRVPKKRNRCLWQVYYDQNENGLKGFVAPGRRKLEISLERSLLPVEVSVENASPSSAGATASAAAAGGDKNVTVTKVDGSANVANVSSGKKNTGGWRGNVMVEEVQGAQTRGKQVGAGRQGHNQR